MNKNPRLQRPWLLQILAIFFILAPFGNILISFSGAGGDDWTQPQVFFRWLASIEPLDWFWLSLTLLTGLLLFIQHKTAWLIAIICLVLILGVNLYRWLTTGELIDVEYSYFHTQILISVLASALALGIVFYARYPYLDRRAPWAGKAAPRVPVNTEIRILSKGVYTGQASNLSTSGVMAEVGDDFRSAPRMKFVDVIFPAIQNLKVRCQVIYQNETRIRLKFRDLGVPAKNQIKKFIESRS